MSDEEAPFSGVAVWPSIFVCIGGPMHGKYHATSFTTLPPEGYQTTKILDEKGEVFEEVFTHKSLTTEPERVQEFAKWLMSVTS